MPNRLIAITFILGSLSMPSGCSESVDGDPDSGSPGTDSGMPGTDSGTPGVDSGSPGTDSGMPGADSGSAPTLEVVINEIAGAGDDWVELRNNGAAAFDLGGYRVTDQDGDAPRLDEAVTFAAGEMLAPGAYLVVVADMPMPMPGRQSTCLMMGGPADCYQAGWGVTRGGDTIYLLPPAGSDTPVETAAYDGAMVMDGQSWARLPDGTGDFAVAMPTPGTANAGL